MSNKLAYVAGLFDGEGSIYIAINKPKPKFHTKSPNHWLGAAIGNTNRPLVDWLKAEFGGHIVKGGGGHVKRQQAYWIWVVSSTQALTFLKRLYPYLRIKKEQAKLGIEFQNQRIKDGNPGRKGISLEVLVKRDWYKKQISALNGLNASLSDAKDINL